MRLMKLIPTTGLALLGFACSTQGDGVVVGDATAPPVAKPMYHHAITLGGPSISATEISARAKKVGGPSCQARLHDCRKMQYQTLGNVLASRGANLNADAASSAGRIWREGQQALGVANYGARVPETAHITTSSATKMLDVLVQAASEIIANMPNRPECQVGGVGATVFNDDNTCNRDGLSCLMGMPATEAQVLMCNGQMERAADPEAAKPIIVASLLSAAHTCE